MKTLQEWLAWQQRVHPRDVDLGLTRITEVWQRLGARPPAATVITVGGTNGKGTTVALLETMLAEAGRAVGSYTSPHLVRYNERVRLRGEDVGDGPLIGVFERIETARGDISLSWFEFGTLAALELMADAGLEVAVLEVGLGGRLDAVNMIDADAAIVTTVGIDHVEYLGPDRDSIGREKAGIFRRGRPAVVADPDPPAGLLEAANERGAQLLCIGRDFDMTGQGKACRWQRMHAGVPLHDGLEVRVDPVVLDAPGRSQNLAAALAALHALRDRLGWHPEAFARAASRVRPPARVQRFTGATEVVVDVAHNPQAATALAGWLRRHAVPGRTLAVFSAMADKDIAGIVTAMTQAVSCWFLCPLPEAGRRGLGSDALEHRVRLGDSGADCRQQPSVEAALRSALAEAGPHDRVVAFGSFHLAGAVLASSALGDYTRSD